MVERMSLDEILAANPHLDRKEVEKALEALRTMRGQMPKKMQGQGPVAPYGRRRRPIVGKEPYEDPRTVYVGRR